jgi:D-serine deaminase-like pyridoxal phosphate-dependent protein
MRLLTDPDTPFAVLDVARLDRNVRRLRDHLDALHVPLRLHVKTAKSVDVARRVHGGSPEPITVSTLAEAEQFAEAGYTDILYAVGIEQHKLRRVAALARQGVNVTVLLDSADQATAVVRAAQAERTQIPALVEVDCDGHRGGLRPDDPTLVQIGTILADGGQLGGVLTHAGESYFAATPEAQRRAAQNERDAIVAAARALDAAGLPCPIVSVGSTPTAHAAHDLAGVTEVRAGNFVFFDLVMAGIGVCAVDDLALSIAVSVIGHQPARGWILTDGGWMAMSRDRGTAQQSVDQGYGLVTDLSGQVIPDLIMSAASQEHGVLSMRAGSARPLPRLPVGTRLRVLPNHACATAAQHDRYHVIAGDPGAAVSEITAVWPRSSGW